MNYEYLILFLLESQTIYRVLSLTQTKIIKIILTLFLLKKAYQI